jgi:hypothetical protein
MLERFKSKPNEAIDDISELEKTNGICPVFMSIPSQGVKRMIHMKTCDHEYCKYTSSFVTAMLASAVSVIQKHPSEEHKAEFELSIEKQVYEILRKSGLDYKTINKILEQVDYLFYVQDGRE